MKILLQAFTFYILLCACLSMNKQIIHQQVGCENAFPLLLQQFLLEAVTQIYFYLPSLSDISKKIRTKSQPFLSPHGCRTVMSHMLKAPQTLAVTDTLSVNPKLSNWDLLLAIHHQ